MTDEVTSAAIAFSNGYEAIENRQTRMYITSLKDLRESEAPTELAILRFGRSLTLPLFRLRG
jgi:hypothetical protein